MFTEIENDMLFALPFGLHTVSGGKEQHPVDRPEGFDFHHLLWVTSGSGVYRVGSDSFILSEGEGIFLRAGVPHSYGGENMYTAWCTFSMSESALDALGIGDYLRFNVTAELQRQTEALYRFATGSSTMLERSAAGYSCVMGLFSSVLAESESVSSQIRRLLEQKYSEPLSLDDIARVIGIDRFNLCHIYKKERGVTIMQDLNSIRLQKAKQMLRYSTDSAELIGKACGFESPSYFGMRFKQYVGCTPNEYRRGGRG